MEENFILRLPAELSETIDNDIENNIAIPLRLKKIEDNKYTLEYNEQKLDLQLERFPTIIELYKNINGNFYKGSETNLILTEIKDPNK